MIQIRNPYLALKGYAQTHSQAVAQEVGPVGAEALELTLTDRALGYAEGAKAQLAVCIADIETWAAAYNESDTHEHGTAIAGVLLAFANDWRGELPGTAKDG